MGNHVPLFKVKTFENKLFQNKSIIKQPYIIAFSATWCIPCQHYKKKLLLLYNKYKFEGLKVVYFNLDDNVAKWQADIKKDQLKWINVS